MTTWRCILRAVATCSAFQVLFFPISFLSPRPAPPNAHAATAPSEELQKRVELVTNENDLLCEQVHMLQQELEATNAQLDQQAHAGPHRSMERRRRGEPGRTGGRGRGVE